MKTDAETNLAGVKKAAEDASGGVNTATVTNWGNSAAEVDKNLDQMKQHANLKLGEMQKTVDSHFSGQYNTMTNKWKWAGERIAQIISEMIRSTERSLEGLAREMKSIGTRMGNNLANGICIVIGMSYDKMNKKNFVPLDRKDFYAYRKKTLAVFRAALQACNRYPF